LQKYTFFTTFHSLWLSRCIFFAIFGADWAFIYFLFPFLFLLSYVAFPKKCVERVCAGFTKNLPSWPTEIQKKEAEIS
jgi:hypothetical protein